MHSARLIAIQPHRVLPASTVCGASYRACHRALRGRHWRRATVIALLLAGLVPIILWAYMQALRPTPPSRSLLGALVPTLPARAPRSLPEAPAHSDPQPLAVAAAPAPAQRWTARARTLLEHPSDHPPVARSAAVTVRVLTIQARVTAYTAMDHRYSKPEWADGVVAWHPRGRKRHVVAHPYHFATDWLQFPGGSTFIHVPGYMDQTYTGFPENFRVVDDKCGQARKIRRRGGRPIIDARFLTRHSAVEGRDAWHSKDLEVEVLFPADQTIHHSLRPWIVKSEWRTYQEGQLIACEPAPRP